MNDSGRGGLTVQTSFPVNVEDGSLHFIDLRIRRRNDMQAVVAYLCRLMSKEQYRYFKVVKAVEDDPYIHAYTFCMTRTERRMLKGYLKTLQVDYVMYVDGVKLGAEGGEDAG